MRTGELVRAGLAEDLGSGDITSRLVVPARLQGAALLVARSDGVLCGMGVCAAVFRAVDPKVRFSPLLRDSRRYGKGKVLARVSGSCRSILAAERTALNFIQHLSGIATLTRRFVDECRGTRARVLDTRKTTPGWRELEKYAVRCGGGTNHRMGLYDRILVKDNHIVASGSITEALDRCRGSRLPVEVEARNIAEVREALAAGARRILLDNMTLGQLRAAVRVCRNRALTEASGGVTLRRVRRIALTGVDFISVGATTHSAPAADIALDFLPAKTG